MVQMSWIHKPGVDRTWLVQLQEEEQVYLKGLAVVSNDRAVFGINPHVSHEKRGHRQLNAEVAVVNLDTHALISRTKVSSKAHPPSQRLQQ